MHIHWRTRVPGARVLCTIERTVVHTGVCMCGAARSNCHTLALSHLAACRGKSASMGARSILRVSSLHSVVVAACDACSNAAAQIHHRDTARSHQTEASLCRRSQCWRTSLMQVQNKQNSGTAVPTCRLHAVQLQQPRGGPYSAVMGGHAPSEGSQRAPAVGS